MMYLAIVLLVTANKIVSYKCVYIFTSKFCGVCLVFMYTDLCKLLGCRNR